MAPVLDHGLNARTDFDLARIARHQHEVGLCAGQPNLQERLVLGAVIETLGRLQRREFQDHKPAQREIAFEAAQIATTHQVAAAVPITGTTFWRYSSNRAASVTSRFAIKYPAMLLSVSI
jgi:hypothetical protein